MVNSEGSTANTEYLTQKARCRINRCRYNRVHLQFNIEAILLERDISSNFDVLLTMCNERYP